nr:DUF551 domain-containing protein [Klebsiella pneumoniae]
MTSNQLTEQQIDLLIENGYDIAHTLENLAENEINSDCFEVFSYSENGRETEWDGKITEFAQRAAKAIRHLTDATTALQAELQERRKADSEPVAEITEDLGRLFVKIHYPTTLRVGDKLYLHAQTSTAGEPVLWAWQNLDMWHVTSHHGRARDLGLSGFKVIPLYRHAQPAPVVQCPFPCGWDNLNKLAIQDAALVARGLVEGELTTEAHRQAAISNNDRLLKVISACRSAMLAAAQQSPGSEPATVPGTWIPVSERMPEVGVKVLCFPAEDEPIHAVFNGQLWLQDVSWSGSEEPIDNVIPVTVTHWMPLPAAPQEVKGE